MPPIGHVFGILLRPLSEWQKIERERNSVLGLLLGYVAILSLVPAIAWFIGVSVIGVPVRIGTFRAPQDAAFLAATIAYFSSFAIILLIAAMTDAIAPTFESARGYVNALKLTAYAHTPFCVAGVFFLFPRFRFVTYALGLYGFYLAWTGLPALLKTPKERALLFTVAIATSTLIVYVLLGIVVNKISGITPARRAI